MAGIGAWYMGRATVQGASDMADAYAKAGGTASETLSEVRAPPSHPSPDERTTPSHVAHKSPRAPRARFRASVSEGTRKVSGSLPAVHRPAEAPPLPDWG